MKLGSVVCAALIVSSACVSPSVEECGGGVVCPRGTTCTMLDETHPLCATSEQTQACAGVDPGAPCSVDGITAGACVGGACVASECGDGRKDPSEVCEDGNTTSGDGCSSDCHSDETCNNGIVDPLVFIDGMPAPNEQCDDGNFQSGDGCSSSCRVESPRWIQLRQPPANLSAYNLVYDSDRRRFVLFGGHGFVFDPVSSSYHTASNLTVYELADDVWTAVTVTTSPQQRNYAMMAYDAARHRVVLFGGTAGTLEYPYDDTWEWDGARWEQRFPTTRPPGRSHGQMVYDAARKRVVLFGGSIADSADLDDTWEWDGNNWVQVTASPHPSARHDHVMAYDPVRATIVLAGGAHSTTGAPTPTLDTWEMTRGTWGLTATTTPAVLVGGHPAYSEPLTSMAYDRIGARMIVIAHPYNGGTASTLAYDGTTWTTLAVATPVRDGVQLASDPVTGRIVFHGGADPGGTTAPLDTFQFTGASWVKLTPPTSPGARFLAASALAPERGVAYVFGGIVNNAAVAGLQAFDGLRWTALSPAGATPLARSGPALSYDEKRHRLVLFGGELDDGTLAADTWEFDGVAWQQMTPALSPAARIGGSMVYDTVRERTVLFGGFASTTTTDTWEWDGTTWVQSATSGPTARALADMTFDQSRGVAVLTGGFDPDTFALFRDTWTYDGTWKPAGDAPYAPRAFVGAFAYDRTAGASVLFGGVTPGGGPLGDSWVWDGAWQPVAAQTSPQPRGGHVAFGAPDGAGTYIALGSTDTDAGGTHFADAWKLLYTTDEAHEVCTAAIDNDGDGKIGCADPDCAVTCAYCGDGVCSAQETCHTCASDCTCAAVCGDNFCDAGETLASCPGDCTP